MYGASFLGVRDQRASKDKWVSHTTGLRDAVCTSLRCGLADMMPKPPLQLAPWILRDAVSATTCCIHTEVASHIHCIPRVAYPVRIAITAITKRAANMIKKNSKANHNMPILLVKTKTMVVSTKNGQNKLSWKVNITFWSRNDNHHLGLPLPTVCGALYILQHIRSISL